MMQRYSSGRRRDALNLRTIRERRGGVATVFGIAGVVAVLVGVLSIAEGFMRAMQDGRAPTSPWCCARAPTAR